MIQNQTGTVTFQLSEHLTFLQNKYSQKSFLPGRVIPYWNKLPPDVKNSATVLSFKIKLEGFKKDMNSKSITNDCFFGMCLMKF